MEIDVNRLTPGMILQKDIVGKSGKPIILKNTEITDLHINFIKNFLIEKVSVSPLNSITENMDQKAVENVTNLNNQNQVLAYIFDKSVQLYKEIFQRVKNNVSLEMYKIRESWIPIFHEIAEQRIEDIIQLMEEKSAEERFYTKNVIMTFLTVALINKLGYEKKDWIQIGFAALLSDIGIAKLEAGIHSVRDENWRLHPIYSYKLIEKEVTLNKQAKLAILQHHEYLDGKGFPAGNKKEKIHSFSQIIAISDFFINKYEKNNLNQVLNLLNTYKNSKFQQNIVEVLVEELETSS